MKVFDTSGQQLVALGIDTGTSNALSVLSQAVSVISQQVSVLSQAHSVLSQAVSVISQAVSVLSQAHSVLSQQVSALSSQVSTVSVAVTSVDTRVNTVSQGVSVVSQALSVQAAALSVRVDTQSQAVSVLSQQVSVMSVITELGAGQCRLSVKSTTSVTLQPYKGQLLWINGKAEKIPSGGVDMGTGGLTSATTYNLYAYMSSVSVMTLTATISAHATDTTAGNVGVEIKSGAGTHTLVGQVRLNAAVNFVNTVTQRFCINWFNRPSLTGFNGFTAARTTTSSSFVELNSEIRIEFLIWADQVADLIGNIIVGAGILTGVAVTSFGFDGTTAEDAVGLMEQAANQNENGATFGMAKIGLAEGYHYVTLLGKSSDGVSTAAWNGAAAGAGPNRCTVYLEL